jgi:hypothetical protein
MNVLCTVLHDTLQVHLLLVGATLVVRGCGPTVHQGVCVRALQQQQQQQQQEVLSMPPVTQALRRAAVLQAICSSL